MEVRSGDRALAYRHHAVEVLKIVDGYAFCDGATFYGWVRLENLAAIEESAEESHAA